MNNKSMTEAELIEFLTALSDSCGNKKKMEWYHGLIEDIGIAFTEHIPDVGKTLEEAKKCIVIFRKDKILIQSAEYIEDGCYIEIVENIITLFEIPYGGGEPHKIGEYNTLREAFDVSNTLT